METLLLFVPSALAVAGLVWHAWQYRGRRIALTYFPAAFLFGAIRGNVIHWIAVDVQDGVMPYVFVNPVIQVFSASLQAIIGWIFAIYVSWWLAERVLERLPGLRGDLMATVGLACVGMAAISYATEAGAAAAGWWVWSIPTHNPYFVGVPALGIAEWFAVGFEFLIPYLLTVCSQYRGRVWPYALWGVFLLHLYTHLYTDPIAAALPTQPYVIWHLLSLLCVGGLALTGVGSVQIQTVSAGAGRRPLHGVMWCVVGVFAGVMAVAQVGIGARSDLLVSIVPLALLVVLALPRVPLRWALVAGGAAWGLDRFGVSFLPGPVVAFLLLAGRARWEKRVGLRVGVWAAVVCLAAGAYVDGMRWSRRCEAFLTHLRRADDFARQGDEARSRKEWAAAQALDPEDAETYLRTGYTLEAKGYSMLATVLYRRAIAMEPHLFTGYYDLGIALESMARHSDAEAAYRRSVEIAPRFYQGHIRLGALLMDQQGRAEQALVHLKRAVELRPKRVEGYNNLGVAYQKMGRGEEARAAWDRALELDPNNADVYSNIGDAHMMQGRVAEAVVVYERAIRIDPDHPNARRGLMLSQVHQQMNAGGPRPVPREGSQKEAERVRKE